jgi:hypothetical protein
MPPEPEQLRVLCKNSLRLGCTRLNESLKGPFEQPSSLVAASSG